MLFLNLNVQEGFLNIPKKGNLPFSKKKENLENGKG